MTTQGESRASTPIPEGSLRCDLLTVRDVRENRTVNEAFGKPPPLEVLRLLPWLGSGHDPYAEAPGHEPELWARSYPRIVTGSHELQVRDQALVSMANISLPRHIFVASIEPHIIPFHLFLDESGARLRIEEDLPCSFHFNLGEPVIEACAFLAVERDEADNWQYLRRRPEAEKIVRNAVRTPCRTRATRRMDRRQIAAAADAALGAMYSGQSAKTAIQESLQVTESTAKRLLRVLHDEGLVPRKSAQ
jgi:hypothetical protein